MKYLTLDYYDYMDYCTQLIMPEFWEDRLNSEMFE